MDKHIRYVLFFIAITMTSCSINAKCERNIHHKTIKIDNNVNVDCSNVKNAIPKIEKLSKGGCNKPYKIKGKYYIPEINIQSYKKIGIASWYGKQFHGRKTSNGEIYDMYAMTAAHKTLPIPCYVKVTNMNNNKRVIVRINDRGPFYKNRIIDLSYAAAYKLDLIEKGIGNVKIEKIEFNKPKDINNLTRNEKDNKEINPIYIQIGAYNQKENALSCKINLEKKLKNSLIINLVNIENINNCFRVKIGPYNNRNIATKDLAKIKEHLNIDARIIYN